MHENKQTSRLLAAQVLQEARDYEKQCLIRSGSGEPSELVPFLRRVKELAENVIEKDKRPSIRDRLWHNCRRCQACKGPCGACRWCRKNAPLTTADVSRKRS